MYLLLSVAILGQRGPHLARSAQNSAGIQTLLDAEREASKIVQKVRTKRVKEARDEAKKEIADYRAQKEDEFQKFQAEAEEEANKEAEKQIQAIKEAGKKGQAGVVQNLLNAVSKANSQAASS
ncbi:V-type H+-transporting ATPase subunit G [Geosmithia morbida]|uniref:V-type proton ATPase subunit G n=1 Tax=Geosmithia morbida TaxID=1094350 RepID=A0A9P4YZK0_9HYPO|nr:V-type H+-transporting ATPase subunit G [Geosmithia morbida]KAF4125963.1 V-type H+-transporting ATPase subunit G [Geosmithia morbida]